MNVENITVDSVVTGQLTMHSVCIHAIRGVRRVKKEPPAERLLQAGGS